MWNRFGAVAEVLSSELFRRLVNTDCIKIEELNAAIALLIESGIDFVVTFAAGSSGIRPTATLDIALSPTSVFTEIFTFECF